MEEAAEILGVSSIKYYDLKQNRTQNYIFSFDLMLDPKGNTGVYLIYAYVRICSILRKAGVEENKSDEYEFKISNNSERDLAMTILRLPEALEAAAKDLMMNRVTDQGETIDISKEQVVKIEVAANRYDLLCVEGIATAFRTYLGLGAVPRVAVKNSVPTE